MNSLNVIDLFCGAGGLSLGFESCSGVHIVAAAEINKDARKTYLSHFEINDKYFFEDVRKIDCSKLQREVGDIDIVIGGPPCQGFSMANRQHNTLISLNNRLVKEYVRIIKGIKPKAFVMENVAMLKSSIHRFLVDEDDLILDKKLKGNWLKSLNAKFNEIELLPVELSDYYVLVKEISCGDYLEKLNELYKELKLLYNSKSNSLKFGIRFFKNSNSILKKLGSLLKNNFESFPDNSKKQLKVLLEGINKTFLALTNKEKSDINYFINQIGIFCKIIRAANNIRELTKNKIYFTDNYPDFINSTIEKHCIKIKLQSYAVLDYIKVMLDNKIGEYNLSSNVLNALDYGVPQSRERFVLIGIRKDILERGDVSLQEHFNPEKIVRDGHYLTVRDAIEDLESIVPAHNLGDPNSNTKLNNIAKSRLSNLALSLRDNVKKIVPNNICTATREPALRRFKALKQGQNFHNLSADLKQSYTDIARTQNTIYMRLEYDRPSKTVVNVRKSMWIHPVLDRAISVREAARLQTFPDSFVFYGSKDHQYQQVGNAVPPFLAKAVAHYLLGILSKCLLNKR